MDLASLTHLGLSAGVAGLIIYLARHWWPGPPGSEGLPLIAS